MASRGRRRFLQWGLAGAAAGAAWSGGVARAGGDKLPEGKMPTRRLGRTGVDVSLVGLGGFHIGQAADEQTATRIIHAAIDHGVNFMDNCWDYNDGKSHVWMGRALARRLSQARLPDDEDRRPHARGGGGADRSEPARPRRPTSST